MMLLVLAHNFIPAKTIAQESFAVWGKAEARTTGDRFDPPLLLWLP